MEDYYYHHGGGSLSNVINEFDNIDMMEDSTTVEDPWSSTPFFNSFRILHPHPGDSSDDNETMTNTTIPLDGNDSEVLRNTMVVYGGLFSVLFVLFCCLRQRYPKIYNIRSYVDELKTSLAEDQLGTFSWLYKVFLISDSEMLDECGMDALCFTRVMEFGLKLSILGMLMSVWLIPTYITSKTTDETSYIEDKIVSISVSHVPSGSYRFIGTVIACYCIFGFTMYNILLEFEWFISYRHQYLSKRRPRNYAVYIQCIPIEYRSKAKLLTFLQQSNENNSILDVHLCVKTKNIKKKVAERDTLIQKLERAITIEQVTGEAPMITTSSRHGEAGGAASLPMIGTNRRNSTMVSDMKQVSMIDILFEQLRESNDEITAIIESIQKQQDDEVMALNNNTETLRTTPRHGNLNSYQQQNLLTNAEPLQAEEGNNAKGTGGNMGNDGFGTLGNIAESRSYDDDTILTSTLLENLNNNNNGDNNNGDTNNNGDQNSTKSKTSDTSSKNSLMGSLKGSIKSVTSVASKATNSIIDVVPGAESVTKIAGAAAGVATGGIKNVADVATGGVKNIAGAALTLITGEEDGTPMNAAFVTFKSLRATQATLQMIQYPEPFAMEVLEAPDPDGKYCCTVFVLYCTVLFSHFGYTKLTHV